MSTSLFTLILCCITAISCAQQQWVEYKPTGQAKGKHIVLISGDEEYRSEEALPMLAQILAKKHGFHCTVLFAIDQATGVINPENQSNIPGLEKLTAAHLMIIFTRFRELPDEQMAHIDNYLKSGKPVIGIRTATHGFQYQKNKGSKFAHYDWDSKQEGWQGGFGRRVLGETWISHHGEHGKEGARALVNGIYQNAKNPILNGVKDIWCASDVYTTTRLPQDAEVLLYGQPTRGMTPAAPVMADKSIMPVAWTMSYEIQPGKKGRVFTSTMGAAIDLVNEDLRRMFINACYWALNLEAQLPKKANVDFITPYKPTMFGFNGFIKGTLPSKYVIK